MDSPNDKLDARLEELKKALFKCVLYERRLELGNDPDDPAISVDFVEGAWPGWNTPTEETAGYKKLETIITDFFNSRLTDQNGWQSAKSGFAGDVATLMARLGDKKAVFDSPARYTMLNTVHPLLVAHGWRIKPNKQREDWESKVFGVSQELSTNACAAEYRNLFESHWEVPRRSHEVPVEAAFARSQDWAKKNLDKFMT